MADPNNVPGLFYVAGKNGMHIARTNIEGCTTECGVTLVKGQELDRCVQGKLCLTCEQAILHLGTVGGSRQPSPDLKAENEALRARIAELEAGLDRLAETCLKLTELS